MALTLAPSLATQAVAADKMPAVRVNAASDGFVTGEPPRAFVPWGFNYDHDEKGRLLEDYWVEEWPRVESDFAEMKKLGANVVRIHLQVAKFLESAERPHAASLAQLEKLLELAAGQGVYLDLTGLGCYHKQDVPDWYDRLDEAGRWQAQAMFWEAVAERCAKHEAIFCYDLMNEPVVPGGQGNQWLGPAFGDKHFVQFISRDLAGRARPEVARAWIRQLTAAIRKHDRQRLVTVGLVPWSLDRPGLTSGFVPEKIVDEVDFVAVHIYPQTGKLKDDLTTLRGFAVGKPVLIEEMFPLKCSAADLDAFLTSAAPIAPGGIGFYWGQMPEELAQSKSLADHFQRSWLELFVKRAANFAGQKGS